MIAGMRDWGLGIGKADCCIADIQQIRLDCGKDKRHAMLVALAVTNPHSLIPNLRPPRDKLIAHLVLAFLLSGICAVLLRVIRMHGALKALINLLSPRLWSAPW